MITFYGIAVWRYAATGSAFYLFNFGYIGTALAAGIFLNSALPKRHVLWGRRIAQFLGRSAEMYRLQGVREELSHEC